MEEIYITSKEPEPITPEERAKNLKIIHDSYFYSVAMIGRKVRKVSPKPFKSGSKINTVKGIVRHPVLKDQLAFIFEEDDSIVECRRCKEVDEWIS